MEEMGSRWANYIDPTPMIFPKAVQERWYRNHARAMEHLYVVQLNSGRLGLIGKRVAVASDQETLVNFCLVNHVVGRVRQLALPEGTRIHRMYPAGRNPGGHGVPDRGVPRL